MKISGRCYTCLTVEEPGDLLLSRKRNSMGNYSGIPVS